MAVTINIINSIMMKDCFYIFISYVRNYSKITSHQETELLSAHFAKVISALE